MYLLQKNVEKVNKFRDRVEAEIAKMMEAQVKRLEAVDLNRKELKRLDKLIA